MNRRKALVRIPLVTAAVALGYTAFKWVSLHTAPDLAYLKKSGRLLAAATDLLIPKTDTPSASECGVPDFIVNMIANGSPVVAQNRFVDGLKRLNEAAISRHQQPFQACARQQQEILFEEVEHSERPFTVWTGKAQRKVLGPTFSEMLRELTVVGYFTSEAGATRALRYEQIPTRYLSCVPYQPGMKAWATH